LTPILVFDLETIPDAAAIRRLGYSSHADDGQAVAELRAARQANGQSDFFPHHLQRIWVIGCAFRDDEGFKVKCLGDGHSASDADEAQRIRQFFATIDRYTPQLVSWNGSGFDAPVLHQRAMIHGVVGAQYWDQGENDRDFKFNNYLGRYHSRHLDLMDVLAAYSRGASPPLDAMAQLCGFPGKLGEDGAQVWNAFLEGRGDSVRAYCETDVVNTYLLYLRFQKIRGALSAQAYADEIQLVRTTISAWVGQKQLPLAGAHWAKFLEAWSTEA